jgi:hypothetical protein
MRSNIDLIVELEREASQFTVLALAIGFDNHTEYVFAGDKGNTEKLANFMEQGGEPIGLMGIQIREKTLTVQCRVLQEYIDEPWAKEYLESLEASFIQLVQRPGAA